MSDWRIRLEPVITPVFRLWWRLKRPMTLGVRAVVTDGEGRVLLVRHTYASGWHLPGGGVENGEAAGDAVTRELAEEGGVAPIGAPALIGLYANQANFPNDHIALYRVDTWQACAALENNEIAERGFFAPNALPSETTPGTRRRLAEVLADAPTSAAW